MTQRREEGRCETPGRPGASGEPGRARRTSHCRLWRPGCQSSKTPPRKVSGNPLPSHQSLATLSNTLGTPNAPARTRARAHARTPTHAHARTPAHAAWISSPPTICKLQTSCFSSGAARRLHNGSLNKRVGTFGGLTHLLRPSPSPAPQHQSPGESGKPQMLSRGAALTALKPSPVATLSAGLPVRA